MPTAHLIHGYLGAGKTTLAGRLEELTGGLRLSIDEWYTRLYAGDQPAWRLDPESWDRVYALLNDLWPALLERGADVILDFGFWSRRSRDEARRLARAAGGETRLYVVTCADQVAKARCFRRNSDPGASFVIDEAAFDGLRRKFEPVDPDEAFELVDTTDWEGPPHHL